MSLLFRFYIIATVKEKGKTQPALAYFCPILPYVRFYPTLYPIAEIHILFFFFTQDHTVHLPTIAGYIVFIILFGCLVTLRIREMAVVRFVFHKENNGRSIRNEQSPAQHFMIRVYRRRCNAPPVSVNTHILKQFSFQTPWLIV